MAHDPNCTNTGSSTRSAAPRVLNKKRDRIPETAVYVGRPSKWGNPFVIGRDGDRAAVIDKYRAWLTRQPHLMARLHELKGRDLVCWCAPEPCHADVLIALANSDTGKQP